MNKLLFDINVGVYLIYERVTAEKINKKTGETYRGTGELAKKVKHAMSMVFRRAVRDGICERNPCELVDLPKITSKQPRSTCLETAQLLLAKLTDPKLRTIVHLEHNLSSNIGEMSDIPEKWMNATDQPVRYGRDTIPPHSIAIWGSYDSRTDQRGKTKTRFRKRVLPLPAPFGGGIGRPDFPQQGQGTGRPNFPTRERQSTHLLQDIPGAQKEC